MAEQKCPHKQVLLEFAAGRGEALQRSAIQAHLEQCRPVGKRSRTATEFTIDPQRTITKRVSESLAASGSYLGCENIDVDSAEPDTRLDHPKTICIRGSTIAYWERRAKRGRLVTWESTSCWRRLAMAAWELYFGPRTNSCCGLWRSR